MGAIIKLSNGREVTITAKAMTVREFRALVGTEGGPEEDDALIAKYSGLKVDELLDLPQSDYRTILFEIVKEANRPIDPNSRSASISE